MHAAAAAGGHAHERSLPHDGPWPRDRRRLAAEIERAAKMGYALEESETDVGVACIGAAICAGHEVVAAISVSLPIARLETAGRKRLIDLVRKTARTISARLKTASASKSPRKTSRKESP